MEKMKQTQIKNKKAQTNEIVIGIIAAIIFVGCFAFVILNIIY